jgi:ribosomal protein S12 methylthiotransferase
MMTTETKAQPTYHIATLGCEKNSVDSEGMGSLLSEAGYAPADAAHADVLIVNTCGFLHASTDQSVGVLNELDAARRPGQLLIAAGCAAHRYGDELKNRVGGIDGLLSTRQWPEIVTLVEHLRAGGTVTAAPGQGAIIPLDSIGPMAGSSVIGAPLAPVQATAQLKRFRRKAQGASAYVKISEGCDHKCAFCIIPAIRGKHVSKPIAELVAEVRDLAEQGVRECLLIAQDSTYYGVDLGLRDGLAQLLTAICTEVPEMRWVRLMYAYPTQVTPGLIETMARYPQICPYIDMPLQHAHPETLRRMKRPNDMARVRRLLADFRAAIPDIALRTTFIVGFPGETDAEFDALLDFIEEIAFDHVGMFTYSPEEGTPAATMADAVPEKIKQRRYRQAMQLQQGLVARKNRRRVGQRLDVLLEGTGTLEDERGRTRPIFAGRTIRQAPEVDGMVFVHARPGLAPGQIIPVRITQATEYDLWGKPA